MRMFLDASVLIAAARGTDEESQKAMLVLDDPDRVFVASEFLKLEAIAPQVGPLLEEGFRRMEGRIETESRIEAIYMACLQKLGYEPEEPKPDRDRIVAYPDNELHRYARAVRRSIQRPEIRELKIHWEVLPVPWKATWAYVSPRS